MPLSSTASSLRSAGQLLPILGVAFGVAVTIGSMVGVGILRVPGDVAALTGSATLTVTVWLLGGLYALLGANYTAELATMMPKAGGPYVFARVAYGDFGGFVVGLCDWVLNTAALAFLAIAFGEYAVALLGGGGGAATVLAAVAVLILFTVLNARGIRFGSDTQKLTSVATAAALLAFVLACLTMAYDVPIPLLERQAATVTHGPFASFALAFQLVLGTYGGWNAAIYFAEEDPSPKRNLPRSLFGGVIVVTCIYVLVNVALLTVLRIPAMAASTLPVATAIEAMFGALSGTLAMVLSLVILVSIINAGCLSVPRTLFAVSRDRLFIPAAAWVSAGGTPVVALVMTTATAVILVATGTFASLIGFYAIVGVLMNLSLVAALVILRRRHPTYERPFKAWGYPLTIVLLATIDVAILASLALVDTANVLTAMAVLAGSYPVYRVARMRSRLFSTARME